MAREEHLRSVGWLALVAAMSACSTSDVGHATVSGTISGASFMVGDAIALVDPTVHRATIGISSTPNLCGDLRDGVGRQNSRILLIDVVAAVGEQLAPGSYNTDTAGPPLDSTLFESHLLDGQCHVTYDPPPDGIGTGVVTLTAVTATTVAGSFDVLLQNGEHITGTFEPTACPEIATATTTTSCVP